MSGGHFDYVQYRISDIVESIERVIERNNIPPSKTEKKYSSWDEDDERYEFSDKTINEFNNAIRYLKLAQVYAQRVDWLLSGDDSEESFHKRLKEDTNGLWFDEVVKN